MIPKLIYPDSFDFGMPAASLVGFDVGNCRKGLHKRASCLDVSAITFEKKPGHAYIHVITTGAVETFGCNSNADGFNKGPGIHKFASPKDKSRSSMELDGGLRKYHNATFEKLGGVYRSHQNMHKKGKPSGYIVKAAYNEDMHRGELLIGVDEKIWAKDLEKLASEQPVYFSIGADVEHDTCSLCGSTHKKRSDYCDHLKNHGTLISKEGVQVYAINDAPLFHDISGVFKPADKIAFGLRKVASAGVLTGADLAELEGLVPSAKTVDFLMKRAAGSTSRRVALEKLSKMEKRLLSDPATLSNLVLSVDDSSCPMPDSMIKSLSKGSPDKVFGSLKKAKVMLSPEEFFKMIMGDSFGTVEKDVKEVPEGLPGIFSKLLDSEGCDEWLDNGSYECGCPDMSNTLAPIMEERSMDPEKASKKVIIMVIRGGSPKMIKSASAGVSPVVDILSREYARYALSFAEGMPEGVQNLTIAKTAARLFA